MTTAPYTYQWTNVPEGSYSINAKATDNLDASTTSSMVAVTVAAHQAQIYDIHTDHLGTPRMVTDASGNSVWEWISTPFGESLPNQNPQNVAGKDFVMNLRFPGQVFDGETGLHYNYFRDYDPSIGRYVESDPIGLRGGINTFAYVGSMPLSRTDPDGLDWRSPDSGPLGSGCGDSTTDRMIPDSFGTFSFLAACRRHDTCYGTCGQSKKSCDDKFYDDMQAECDNLPWYMKSKRNCRFAANAYYLAVVAKGKIPYANAQKKAGCCK